MHSDHVTLELQTLGLTKIVDFFHEVCMIVSLTMYWLFCIVAGEDGQVKIWSRSGMLRSTLSQNSKYRSSTKYLGSM